jgi:hypothetical protein
MKSFKFESVAVAALRVSSIDEMSLTESLLIHGTYSLEQSRYLCTAIKEYFVENTSDSQINWIVISRNILEKNIDLSPTDCYRLWKLLAYGDWNEEVTKIAESDDEEVYYSPREALRRFKRRRDASEELTDSSKLLSKAAKIDSLGAKVG